MPETVTEYLETKTEAPEPVKQKAFKASQFPLEMRGFASATQFLVPDEMSVDPDNKGFWQHYRVINNPDEI